MSILTPLWWSTTSAWTLMPASTHGSLVTASPSTTSRVESSTVSPTLAVEILSTSTMSPTATLCWRPPLRTMAYTRISLSLEERHPRRPAARQRTRTGLSRPPRHPGGRGLRGCGGSGDTPTVKVTGPRPKGSNRAGPRSCAAGHMNRPHRTTTLVGSAFVGGGGDRGLLRRRLGGGLLGRRLLRGRLLGRRILCRGLLGGGLLRRGLLGRLTGRLLGRSGLLHSLGGSRGLGGSGLCLRPVRFRVRRLRRLRRR